MNQPQQWNQGGMNPWDQQGAGCGCHSGFHQQQQQHHHHHHYHQDGITPVFLFTDGGNSRALMLHPDAQSYEPAVYSRYWNDGQLFCISQRETPQTPKPLYAYRLDKGNQQYNHFYTTNAAEIGVTRAGQVGNYGYRCLGILGYVGTQETAAQGHRRMIPIYRWYSGSLNQHLFDPDEGLGARLNQGYGAEGIMGYVYQC